MVRRHIRAGLDCVVEATVHESPPEAFLEYRAFFETLQAPRVVRVLHPRLEIAIARDAARAGWHAGSHRVASLRARFSGGAFPAHWFLDTSGHTPEETVGRLHQLREA